ncbi:hypothetical protein GGTG_00516 [Gaeumannomyces tritici R3-111a-1]|uniref:Uncharacterized protein n=1 Tax=Gaeumannomyces tritici (strain R3-111a-1) TaxID=644352 RepID=J3NGY0_GAET3|nr:hypothetical protein GGTG_00516 [Gaeumannomyces tritici R3-111a-1]EJT80520.1 hypothetical protein GGTG_00516 [Gaeumannomyces tritici R3-111a-1]
MSRSVGTPPKRPAVGVGVAHCGCGFGIGGGERGGGGAARWGVCGRPGCWFAHGAEQGEMWGHPAAVPSGYGRQARVRSGRERRGKRTIEAMSLGSGLHESRRAFTVPLAFPSSTPSSSLARKGPAAAGWGFADAW